jgi:acetyl esterase/lipase
LAQATAGAIALVLAASMVTGCRTMPETGRYSSVQHQASQLTTVANQVYGRAEDHAGAMVDLKLDLFLPPAGGPTSRPTVVLIHGGSFSGGDKANMAGTARTYAQRGYVAVSLGYRLDPNASQTQERYLSAARDAIDDGMEAARWLRANAATYRIDPTRIAFIGSSAGGAVALGVGVSEDPTPGGPLASVSPRIAAAVSTGAHVTPGIDLGFITFDAADAPALMFHYELDTVTGVTAAYAGRTCQAISLGGSRCKLVVQPGSGHTTTLAAGATWWSSEIGTFLWNELRLHPS